MNGDGHESPVVNKETMRQLQDYPPQRRGAGYLQESQAQAAPGIREKFEFRISNFEIFQ